MINWLVQINFVTVNVVNKLALAGMADGTIKNITVLVFLVRILKFKRDINFQSRQVMILEI